MISHHGIHEQDDLTEMVQRCLLCPDEAPARDRRFERLLGLTAPYAVQRCPACGLRWLSPRPTDSAYENLYSYENYFAGGDTPEHYEDVAARRKREFRGRIQRLEKSAPRPLPLRILDVGAATGEFVNEALQRGHWAEGLEPSEGARAQARARYGISLSEETIERLSADGEYDVVHMSHVLEHVPDPHSTLGSAYRLLKPGGELTVEVPQQFENDLDRIRRWLGLAPAPVFDAYSLHHTYFFTPTTLTELITQHGFDVRSLLTALNARTPLWPLSARMTLLRALLWTADRIHKSGNIIEIRATKVA